ncbi:hypothetical protein [Candidatus Amarolinea dominans]|uniref:WD40 repeat domain-containing protein n=1 Tax=Candidatus Amarolinea dominans TaxID=3140696 RepID=UPI001D3D308E|nr:hypothetical protein [Anaerolineae bacterium]
MPRFESDYGGIKYAAFNPADDAIVTAGLEGELVMWDVKSGMRLRDLIGHFALVNAVAFEPAGRYLASVSDDQSLRLWKSDSGEPVYFREGHSGPSRDRTARLWSTATGEMLHVLEALEGNLSVIRSAKFSHDGQYIVTASAIKPYGCGIQ